MGTVGRTARKGKRSNPAAAKLAIVLREHKELLEHQAATAAILRVIASGTESAAPVFDAITQAGARLLPGTWAALFIVRDGQEHYVSHTGVADARKVKVAALFPRPLDRTHVAGATILRRKIFHFPDLRAAEAKPYKLSVEIARRVGYRALLSVPLLRARQAIGALTIGRVLPGPFTQRQIALVKTFADQAVIAIENARLFNETKEALEQQTASSEVLGVISSSPSDLTPVFDAILANATRLCGAHLALLNLYVGGEKLRTVAQRGGTPEFAKWVFERGEFRPSLSTTLARTIETRQPIQVADVRETPSFREGIDLAVKFVELGGARTYLSVPLFKDDRLLGTISIYRPEVRPFTEKQVDLVKSFGRQAVIAMDNVRLFNEIKEALEHQQTSADILRIVSQSVADSQPAFEAILAAARRLFPGFDSTVWRVDKDTLVAVARGGPTMSSAAGHGVPITPEYVHGIAILERRPVRLDDVESSPEISETSRQDLLSRNRRAILMVPFVRDGDSIGAISVSRSEPYRFSEKHVALLQAFASQAVIAIENARLFNETREALERQTATAEILKVIASSPTEVQPVFDVIVERAVRLCGASFGRVYRYDGSTIHMVASHGLSAAGLGQVQRVFPRPASDDTIVGRVILARRPNFLQDIERDQTVPPLSRQMIQALNTRSQVTIPMLRAGQPIGAITLGWDKPSAFNDQQVALLQAFADQAVIAVENVRLFNETKESLEQQTATAEILKVISQSPTATQPVFDAIVQSGARLFAPSNVVIVMREGEVMQRKARAGSGQLDQAKLASIWPLPFDPERSMAARAISERRVIEIPDTEAEGLPPIVKPLSVAAGYRAITLVPLIREGEGIGVIAFNRPEPGFKMTEKQLALVRTFADQAVIAIENVRLFNETKEALERQTASGEVLRVISGTPADAQPVFDAIAQSALRVFNASHVGINVLEGGVIKVKATGGSRDPRGEFEIPLDHNSTAGRSVLDRALIKIEDTEAPDVASFTRESGRLVGFRAIATAPMLREGTAVGSVSMMRKEPGPLGDKQLELLQTFADQAVIAIENARLFNETKEALEQQTATAEILKVISGSPTDTRPVFQAIAERAARICEASDARIHVVDGSDLRYVAGFGDVPAPEIGTRRRIGRGLAIGRAVIDGRPVHVEDVQAVPHEFPVATQYGVQFGWRTVLAVPLMRESRALGAISLRRAEVRPFSEKQIALLRTFADQAAIAIENVRLFNETKESLEKQTATAEILNVISRSPTDVRPVFDTIVRSAIRLMDGRSAGLFTFDGVQVHLGSAFLGEEDRTEAFRDYPAPIEYNVPSILAIKECRVVNVADMWEGDWPNVAKDRARISGYRASLAVPMLRGGKAIGSIAVTRSAAGQFAEHHVTLLKTFADQAVIAIENVRLFKELQERTEALTKSVGQLTALGEVGQAISSTLDLETVLKTIVARAVQLTGLDGGSIYEYDEPAEEYHLRATENYSAEVVEVLRRAPIRRNEGPVWQAGVTGQPTQIAEMRDESYQTPRREFLLRTGYRALLVVPLMRENRIVGALTVTRKAPGAFAPEVVELLKTFATQSALAIQNARLFREIAEKGKQLEVASEHKSHFLASMSHELRTPLNALLGFNEMLLGGVYGEVPGDMGPPLAQMQSSGKHLLRLINNVLDLAKIEAGRMELALAEYSVHDTVESVRSTLQPLAVEKGLDFLAAVPSEIPLAYGDPGRIAQCLMNLAGNSLKFTKSGKVEISVAMDDGVLRYRVVDTGIGIPPDKIEGLFTEFKQTDATVASEYGGTGLGLSISKKFVEMHGGRIWAESEPGRGSVFTFEVPLRAKAP
jgi:GAF domain-containing protein/anti-sigma regulatory factor (Ser/Thr protein kinase)